MLEGKMASWSLALVIVFTLSGCKYGYNGAVSSKGDKRAQQEYDQFVASQGGAGDRQAAGQSSRKQGVQFDRSDARPPRTALAQAATDSASASARQYASAAGQAPLSQLKLYGEVADPTPRTASPMDGADNVRRITFANEGNDFDPDVDPTGQWLVYASTRHRETSDIYMKRVDGTAVIQLTNDPANDVMPRFSPDGRFVAFASDRTGSWDIYMMEVAGGQAVQLTNDTAQDLRPGFSPDGKQLVYCSYGSQSGQWELVLIDVDNPAKRKIIGHGLFPAWSPTGNRIVYQKARERGTRWFSIWTLDLVNGEATRVTEVAASTNAACITPGWSPDGQHIVFSTVINPTAEAQDRPVQADVWIVAGDGTGRANLTRSAFVNLQPVWAADGSIFFVSNRGEGGAENIFSVRPTQAIRVAQTAHQSGTATALSPQPESSNPQASRVPQSNEIPVTTAPAQAIVPEPPQTLNLNQSGVDQSALVQPEE